MKALQFAALALVLLSTGLCQAEPQADDAKQWLERMIQATQTLDYEGTFVYIQGPHVESMQIIHSGGTDGERQRLSSLNGSVREVVVDNNNVTCLLPKQQVIFTDENYQQSPLLISLPRELNKLESNYRFEMLGRDRIAGRETQVIAIQPRDRLRFGYRLWLDENTGMVLRSALIGEAGHVLEQLMFTELEVKPEIDPSLFSVPPSQKLATPVLAAPASEKAHQSAWSVSAIPQGFKQVKHSRSPRASSSKPHPTEHIVFSDGLATVSVFLEPLAGAQALLEGPSRMGAMNAFGVVIDDHQALVVGEAPRATVEMIANSLERVQQVAEQ